MLETDFGTYPVEDENYDELKGPLYGKLVEQLEKIWPYMPDVESISLADGRIGLWGDGEVYRWIRIKFKGELQFAVAPLV